MSLHQLTFIIHSKLKEPQWDGSCGVTPNHNVWSKFSNVGGESRNHGGDDGLVGFEVLLQWFGVAFYHVVHNCRHRLSCRAIGQLHRTLRRVCSLSPHSLKSLESPRGHALLTTITCCPFSRGRSSPSEQPLPFLGFIYTTSTDPAKLQNGNRSVEVQKQGYSWYVLHAVQSYQLIVSVSCIVFARNAYIQWHRSQCSLL